jgi:hypothetical protein
VRQRYSGSVGTWATEALDRDASFVSFTTATAGADWSGDDFGAAQRNHGNVRLTP